MKHAPYGPPVSSLLGARLLRSSQVCVSIFSFPLRTRWGNQNLTGKMTLGCPRLTYCCLPILRLFLSFFFTLVAFGSCNDDFDLY